MRQLSDELIRTALTKHLRTRVNCAAVLVEELGISHGYSRIDMALVADALYGFEIKSDLDDLRRLPRQLRSFGKVFDQLVVVSSLSHAAEVLRSVPRWCGVWLADGSAEELSISVLREPQNNPTQDVRWILRFLWKSEALRLLEEAGAQEGVRSEPKRAIYERLIAAMPADILRLKVTEILRCRPSLRHAH